MWCMFSKHLILIQLCGKSKNISAKSDNQHLYTRHSKVEAFQRCKEKETLVKSFIEISEINTCNAKNKPSGMKMFSSFTDILNY